MEPDLIHGTLKPPLILFQYIYGSHSKHSYINQTKNYYALDVDVFSYKRNEEKSNLPKVKSNCGR